MNQMSHTLRIDDSKMMQTIQLYGVAYIEHVSTVNIRNFIERVSKSTLYNKGVGVYADSAVLKNVKHGLSLKLD